MNFGENIRLALEGLRANKMRALLTMLGIIIGIASVIGILTVGQGLSGSVTGSLSSLGATNIMVSLQERDAEDFGMPALGGRSGGAIDDDNLVTDEMIEALQTRFSKEIVGVSLSESGGSGQAKIGRKYANISVTGINTDYLDVNSVTMRKGRNLLARDLYGKRNVAVVSDKLVNNLYNGDENAALGQELIVYINNEIFAFNIIGVYEYEASSVGFSTSSEKDVSTSLYIPITTAKRLFGTDSGYASFTVSASTDIDSAGFATQVEDYMNRYYAGNDDYRISASSMESILKSLNAILDNVSIGLSVIAGISLLVGGIGVMNIMLVSVTERTREIGTRKALGATNNNIRLQFVVESIIVCLIGGVIGMILGALLGYAGSSLLGTPAAPTASSILLAVCFSLGIGIFFGYYPANKAAKMDPIEALRYE